MALLPETELEQLARDHFTFEVLALIDALGKGAAGPAPHGRFLSEGLPWHALGTHDLLLHTRLLANFIRCSDESCGRSHNDDIEARHYVSGWQEVDVLGKDRERIDKALAHLSRQRLGLGRIPHRERIDMASRVLVAILGFIETLPSPRRPWFKQAETAIRATVT